MAGLHRVSGGLRWAAVVLLLALAACSNSPRPTSENSSNTLYSALLKNSPRHLDPTASYWSNDTPFTYQIYEPLYGYHYLKRPFSVVAKSAAEVVHPRYIDKDGKPLADDADGALVAESIYDVPIKRGILFQPHPAFAKDEQGRYRYHAMKPGEVGARTSPLEFEHSGTRELVAEDFVYALKRHATTRITTPIAGIFSEYIVGLKDYMALVKDEDAKLRTGLDPASLDRPFLDFRRWPLAGASAPEKHLLRIRIKGKYPQWTYWMTLTFVAPLPWEADAFYAQPGMAANGLTLDNWPVGTGPYMATVYEKDRRHEMVRNPNYRGEPYPCEGSEADKAAGRLEDCGKKTPFIDRMVFTIEKEAVPLKGKFRQGYYDIEVFERTDTGLDYIVEMQDSAEVRAEYERKAFQLPKFDDVNNWFIGFNMLDPTIGWGDTPEQRDKNRKLRQALSIALDWEDYSKVFPKSAGDTAMGPLPAGIPGSRQGTPEGINPVTHRLVDGKAVRRPIEDAKRLLAEAGYPNGRSDATGQPLVINYDYYSEPTPETKSAIDWVVKQFAKLDVQVEVRATSNNQFQDKVRKGKHQMYWSGWLADYPDAENFLFLLYGPNGKTTADGENTSNYSNPAYDDLFAQLKTLDDGPAKQALIDKMTKVLQDDAPWSFGYFPYASASLQGWVHNSKPAVLIRDHGRYLRLDTTRRAELLAEWNRPVWWPLLPLAALLAWPIWVALRSHQRRERLNARGELISQT